MGQRYHNQRTHYRNILTNMITYNAFIILDGRGIVQGGKKTGRELSGWKKTGVALFGMAKMTAEELSRVSKMTGGEVSVRKIVRDSHVLLNNSNVHT